MSYASSTVVVAPSTTVMVDRCRRPHEALDRVGLRSCSRRPVEIEGEGARGIRWSDSATTVPARVHGRRRARRRRAAARRPDPAASSRPGRPARPSRVPAYAGPARLADRQCRRPGPAVLLRTSRRDRRRPGSRRRSTGARSMQPAWQSPQPIRDRHDERPDARRRASPPTSWTGRSGRGLAGAMLREPRLRGDDRRHRRLGRGDRRGPDWAPGSWLVSTASATRPRPAGGSKERHEDGEEQGGSSGGCSDRHGPSTMMRPARFPWSYGRNRAGPTATGRSPPRTTCSRRPTRCRHRPSPGPRRTNGHRRSRPSRRRSST